MWKTVLKGLKMAKMGKKGLKKVQKHQETVKISPKFVQWAYENFLKMSQINAKWPTVLQEESKQ